MLALPAGLTVRAPGKPERAAAAAAGSGSLRGKDDSYYRITCRDNGCGMPHDKVPDMLGRVLSGSKYGVRQTRGKFGLGAKMALIYAKKTSGLPVEVVTAHGAPASGGAGQAPARVTSCRLEEAIPGSSMSRRPLPFRSEYTDPAITGLAAGVSRASSLSRPGRSVFLVFPARLKLLE
jgi:hypothetical protein